MSKPVNAITEAGRKRWVAALRSGRYAQGRGWLRVKSGGHTSYCCLGVLDEINRRPSVSTFNLLVRDPASDVGKAQRLGIAAQSDLSEMNDGGATFKKIADHIESTPLEDLWK